MLNLCIITPTPHLHQFATLGDMHLILSHLLKVEDANVEGTYTNFYRVESEAGVPIIMDNGLFEHGVAEPAEMLIEKAKMVGASIVVAPDVLYNRKETLRSFLDFRDRTKNEDFGLMAVPQANTMSDYIESYLELVEVADLIGLSILAIPHCFKEYLQTTSLSVCRKYAIRRLKSIVDERRWHHCLGLGDDVSELSVMSSETWIKSCDTSSPVVHGARGIVYERDGKIPGGKCPEKLDFEKVISFESHKDIYHNIAIMRKFANG